MNLRARSRFRSRFSYKPILLRQNSKRVELLWFPQDITESCVCDMSGVRTRDSGLCCDMGNTWHAWHVTRSSPQLYRKLPTIRVPVTCLLCMWGRGCDSRIVRHTALTCDGPMLSHQEKNFRGAWESDGGTGNSVTQWRWHQEHLRQRRHVIITCQVNWNCEIEEENIH